MKYDRVPRQVMLPESVGKWAEGGFLLVAGSTHMGEEQVILDAFDRMRSQDLKIALVPRHPERFDEVAGLLGHRGYDFQRFSGLEDGRRIESEILLVDAMGVLDGFYALSDAAFVGGSLVPVGGHNILEPAMHGVPVLTGPHLHNFREMAEKMISSGACSVVEDAEGLVVALESLIHRPENSRSMGAMNASGTEEGSGASTTNVKWILSTLKTDRRP
jgi:3-deoxy-D-manno-octulosonic-acid transferase